MRFIKKQILLLLLMSSFYGLSNAASLRDNSQLHKGRLAKESAATAIQAKRRVTLKLVSIESFQTMEARGDEIYFDILEFGNDRRPRHYHIPKRPHHWPSSILTKVKNIQLWQGQLNAKEQVKLIVSLLDKDAPPWNSNDLIGAFEISISQKDSKAQFIFHQAGAKQKAERFLGAFSKQLNFQVGKARYKLKIDFQSSEASGGSSSQIFN